MGEVLQQTVKGAKWTYFSFFARKGTQFLIGLILARLLTPADFGLLGMLGIFLAIASTFIDSGMTNALIRKKDADNNDYSTVFYFNLGVSILAYLVLFICAPFIADFYDQPILKDVVRVTTLNLVIGSFGAVQGARFQKDLNFKTPAWISVCSSIVSGGIGIAFAYFGFGVWSLVYQSIASTVFTVFITWICSSWRPSFLFSKKSFHNLFGYGSKILAASLLHTIYDNLTSVLIGKFYTPQQLGYYSRGTSLPIMVKDSVISPLLGVTFPILSKHQDDDSFLASIYRKYINTTCLPIYFLLILLAALAKPITLILVTEKWAATIPYMQVFCFCYLAENVTVLNLNLLYVKGRSDLLLKLEVIKKSISLVLLLCAVPLGVMAICLARLLYSQIAVFINTYYTGKLLNLGYWQQVKDFFPYIIFSILACTPAYLLSFTTLNNWLICFLGGVMALILYLGILHFSKNDIYEQYFLGMILPKVKTFFPKRN